MLDLLAEHGPALSLTEISDGVGLSRSTCHRLLSTLEQVGMVERAREAGQYRLGRKAFRLGSMVVRDIDLLGESEPILLHLADETEETAYLVVPDRDEALCLRRIDGRHEVRVMFLDTGKRLPFNCGATPRILLAHMPPEQWTEIVAHYTKKMTPYSLVTPEELERDAHEIQQSGYAISREDVTLHACAIGVPVWNYTGRVVASISISGIIQRFSTERLPFLIKTVVDAGHELSRRLGYGSHPPINGSED